MRCDAMRVAKAIVESDSNACVLIGAVELCSLHQQYTDDAQQLVANALFADGAASLVIGTGKQQNEAWNIESMPNWRIVATGSTILANTSEMMSWTIGEHGFQMSLSPQVPILIEEHLRAWLESWLDENGLDLNDVDAWAIHPGGPRIVQSTGQSLDLDSLHLEPSLKIFRQHGNMSSPTILFILKEITQENPMAKSCLMIAFGPGLCIEVAFLQRECV